MKIFNTKIGIDKPLFLIAGPCVIESEKIMFEVAATLKKICSDLGILYIFKASFDKANRSSVDSYRGPGIDVGLKMLQKIKDEFDLPILTDVHEDTPLDEVSDVVDMLQTPAFLCRQTNFIQNVAKTNLPINIKKGQFLAPQDMALVVEKAQTTGNKNICVCERGYSFGYNNLVSDMRSLVIMRATDAPVIYDATHSVQLPGGLGKSSGGAAEFIPPLSRAAVAVGISGIFMETHPNPAAALSDGPNSARLSDMKNLLKMLVDIDNRVKNL
ncbi:MAG: 3-deoxy-8-phosphooctulonate synthase [Gammaproteobacteria bacterium]|nr:MAG: 3-deoxy-8-phosphooctulonate synthase [Gammaproteobacteria bacterium]